jgi:O-antigen/teichoic acid export membrane protein
VTQSATQWKEERGLFTFARNVATRYLMIVINALIGIVVLPFNVHHLGASAYGLWMLTTGVTAYFTVLDLGYGGAVVKFVAEYRAKKDPRALNEILSTMLMVYAGIGAVAYTGAVAVSFALPHLFNLEPGQAKIAQLVLLITAAQVALFFPFSVFGGVTNGFQRYYVNNIVGTVSNIVAAALNVAVLAMGYGLVELVSVTTIARIVPFFVYRLTAYAAFPEMSLRRAYFRKDRLRELTGFSAYLAIIDWSSRLTFTTDAFFIGAFINTTAVGVYAVAQRLADALLRMSSQFHNFLFPAVVHRAVDGSNESQRDLLVKATRFQLAIAVCMCGGIAAVADVLIPAWVGPGFGGAISVTRLLAVSVVLRAWMAMPSTVLKGTGHHKFVAVSSAWCAVANLLLSIPLVKLWGLPGVALGTVIPVMILGAGFIFPKACRVVELSVWRGYREVVWPALWPAVVTVSVLLATRHAIPVRIVAVLAHLAAGGLLYVALFYLFGLGRDERRWFSTALNQMWRRGSQRFATA